MQGKEYYFNKTCNLYYIPYIHLTFHTPPSILHTPPFTFHLPLSHICSLLT